MNFFPNSKSPNFFTILFVGDVKTKGIKSNKKANKSKSNKWSLYYIFKNETQN